MKHPPIPRLLLALLMALTATYASAYDFEVNGIYYNIISDTSVSVTGNVRESHSVSVTIPSQVTYYLTTYDVTRIDDYAFYRDYNLTSVTIGNSVTKIGYRAFNECHNLQYAYLGSSVSTIDDEAFRDCGNLSSIYYNPNVLTWIGYWAFYGTEVIRSLRDGPIYIGKVLYEYKGSAPIFTSIVVANGTVSISPAAFASTEGLTSVTIPQSVTRIGICLFSNCPDLQKVVIGDGVSVIPKLCFANCKSLNKVQIGSGVTEIEGTAFEGSSNISTIISKATTPPTISPNTFNDLNKWTTCIYVPDGCISAYQQAYGWSDFLYILGNESVTIDNDVTATIEGGLLNCSGVYTEVYTLTGAKVYGGDGEVELAAGVYIVVANGRVTKVYIK